jgi:hypothetical protein
MSVKIKHLLANLVEEISSFKDTLSKLVIDKQEEQKNSVTIKKIIHNVQPYFIKLTYHEATIDISEVKIIEKGINYYSGEYYQSISIKTKTNTINLTYKEDKVENMDLSLELMRNADFKEFSNILLNYSKKINNKTILSKNIKAI